MVKSYLEQTKRGSRGDTWYPTYQVCANGQNNKGKEG